jgi:hypothetical protein
MASSVITTKDQSPDRAETKQPLGGLRYDWLMSIMSFVFVGGLFLDGWAHAHGKVDGTFFTPWHAVLYGGYFINALLLVGTLVINHSRGRSWQKALPTGYELSLVGVPLFAVGGVGDLIWHALFGFETGVDQVLSPTHLVLAFSGILIMTGAFRAALRRRDSTAAPGWRKLLPMLLSMVALLLIFTFFTEFANPFVRTYVVIFRVPSENLAQSLGVASILIQTGVLTGLILLVVRRWTLPPGALTLIFTLNIALISVLADQYLLIPAVVAAGIAADLLLRWLRPSAERQNELRLFAFLMPAILFLFYFLDLMITHGIVWTIHLWLGSCIMAGAVGLLLSYLLVPPQGPLEEEE